MDLGMQEIAVILFIALLVYGGNLPAVALKVGGVVGQLKRALRETTDMVRVDVEAEARRAEREKRKKRAAGAASPEDTEPEDEEPEEELRPYRNPEDMPEDPDEGYAQEEGYPGAGLGEGGSPAPPELATEDITVADPPSDAEQREP